MISGKRKTGDRAGVSAETSGHRSILAAFLWSFLLFLLFQSYSVADICRYVDVNQVIHLTNVPTGPEYKVLIKEKQLNSRSAPLSADPAPYNTLIVESAVKYGVDCELVKAIIKVESNFNHKAVSRKGAKGLMQLMPQTASILGVNDCFHPQANIDGGIRHLAYLIGLYKSNLSLALAAYNAGESAVAKYGGIPPFGETKTYVRQVLDTYAQYRKNSTTRVVASASYNYSY
jgi:soluble lytic murein transglycosylase-like protein